MSFLFAWAASGEPVFSESEHGVDGQDVFALEINQEENLSASAVVEIDNPREGLLAPGRPQWAWISWQDDSDGSIIPVFFGKVRRVPDDLDGETIRLIFDAIPEDLAAQKAALAEALKVAPYYDPVWIAFDRLADPDTVLEGYNALWHIDRVTHVLTISDNLRGEDGTLDIVLDDHFYDDLRIKIGAAPLTRLDVSATVKWTQAGAGSIDLTAELLAAFALVSNAHSVGQIASYTGEGLVRDWPEPGDTIGAEYKVGDSSILVLSGTAVNASFTAVDILPQAEEVERLEGMTDEEYETLVLEAQAAATADPIREARFFRWIMAPEFGITYETRRDRTEILTFSVSADVQGDDGRAEDLIISSNSVAVAVDGTEETESASGSEYGSDGSGTAAGLGFPIGDIRRNHYFNLDRGKRSLETLLCIARARLLLAARSVTISVRTPIETGFDLSCRRDGQVTDDRLPGGVAAGKVLGYSMIFDPGSGDAYCDITIGCTIGRGDDIGAAAPGVPTYGEEDYTGADYQFFEGRSVIPIAGEISYADFLTLIPDDGIDLSNLSAAQVLVGFSIAGGELAQEAILDETYPTVQDAITALNAAKTEVSLRLVPLNVGPFETLIDVAVSDLMVPKTIDLEAVAVSA